MDRLAAGGRDGVAANASRGDGQGHDRAGGGCADDDAGVHERPADGLDLPIDGAMADGVLQYVSAAREGPGGPHPRCETEDVASRTSGAVATTSVAAGGMVTTRRTHVYARSAAGADRGEVTTGPPCDPAVSQDSTRSTDGEATGRDEARTLQAKPRGVGGGGPPGRRSNYYPHKPPQSLGVGPSIQGHEDQDEDGQEPTIREKVRRRDGSADTDVPASAARDRGGAAALNIGQRPSKGLKHRTPGARESECRSIKRSAGVLIIPVQSGEQGRRGAGLSSGGSGSAAATYVTAAVGDGCKLSENGKVGRAVGGTRSLGLRLVDIAAQQGGSEQHEERLEDAADGRGQPSQRPTDRETQGPSDKRRRMDSDSSLASGGDQSGTCGGATADSMGSFASHRLHRQHRGPIRAWGPVGSGIHRRFTSPQGGCSDLASDDCVSDSTNTFDNRAPATRPPRPRAPRPVHRDGETAEADTGVRRGGGSGSAGDNFSEEADGSRSSCGASAGPSSLAAVGQPADAAGGELAATTSARSTPSAGHCGVGRIVDTADLDLAPRTAKRRRIVGKQRPSAGYSPLQEVASARGGGVREGTVIGATFSLLESPQPTVGAIDESSFGDMRAPHGRGGHNSVQVGESGGPSRSNTSSVHRAAGTDRDGHLLTGRAAGDSSGRDSGLAQRGAGLAERTRGRGASA